MTIDKWASFKSHKYKDLILAIFKNSLKHRLFHQKQLEENYLKSGHCMPNIHKSKINFKTSALCVIYQIKETPSDYLIGWNKFKKEREAVLNNIPSILNRNKFVPQNVTIEDLFLEQNFSRGDYVTTHFFIRDSIFLARLLIP